MAFNMIEVLHGLSELACPEVALAKVNLKPHSLHLVHASLVATGAEEEVHGVVGFFKHIHFGHLLGTECVERPVGRVEDASLFKELHTSVPVSSSLVDLSFNLIQLNQSWRVLDCHIYVVKGAFKLPQKEVVLGQKAQKPEVHCRVLLLLVLFSIKSVELVHRVEITVQHL